MSLFEVKAKCGHVGRKYYALKTFAVIAESGKEAAHKVRNLPRVKHHHKDAIVEVQKIDENRYWEIININAIDPYFSCHNVQEQRSYVDHDIYPEENYYEPKKEKKNIKQVFSGKTLIRSPRKYIRNYYYEEGWAY